MQGNTGTKRYCLRTLPNAFLAFCMTGCSWASTMSSRSIKLALASTFTCFISVAAVLSWTVTPTITAMQRFKELAMLLALLCWKEHSATLSAPALDDIK